MHPPALIARARALVNTPRRLLAVIMVAALCLTLGVNTARSTKADAWWNSQSMFGWQLPKSTPDVDNKAVEVGTKFRVDQAGVLRGMRYYKSSLDTGTHTGTLWTRDGQVIAAVTFTNETSTGWQTAAFSKPIPVQPGITYVVSYHTNVGHYYADSHYFDGKGSGLHDIKALAAGVDGANGVYAYGPAGTFPTGNWLSANYWVDAIYQPAPTSDGTLVPTNPTTTVAPTTTAAPTTSTTAAPAPTTTAAPTTSTTAAPAPTTTAPPATSTTAAPAPTTTAPPAPSGGMPDGTNTGVPAGTVLTPSNGMTVTTAGAVIDALDVQGTITIAAPNVTIKRSRFTGTGGDYAIYVRSGSVTVQDTEISGVYHTAAIAFDNWTAIRLNVHDLPDDGFKIGNNVTLQDSWIHNFAPEAGAHADGGQVQNGIVNSVVAHNTIDIPVGNSALFIAPDLGPSTAGPVTIRDNVLGGGNYTLYIVDGNNGQYYINSITATGNRFLRDFQYGATRVNVPVTWSNNAYLDNGSAVTM